MSNEVKRRCKLVMAGFPGDAGARVFDIEPNSVLEFDGEGLPRSTGLIAGRAAVNGETVVSIDGLVDGAVAVACAAAIELAVHVTALVAEVEGVPVLVLSAYDADVAAVACDVNYIIYNRAP